MQNEGEIGCKNVENSPPLGGPLICRCSRRPRVRQNDVQQLRIAAVEVLFGTARVTRQRVNLGAAAGVAAQRRHRHAHANSTCCCCCSSNSRPLNQNSNLHVHCTRARAQRQNRLLQGRGGGGECGGERWPAAHITQNANTRKRVNAPAAPAPSPKTTSRACGSAAACHQRP